MENKTDEKQNTTAQLLWWEVKQETTEKDLSLKLQTNSDKVILSYFMILNWWPV